MSSHPKFVTACQQLLVLGVVCVAMTSALGVITLDIQRPGAPASPGTTATGQLPPLSMAAYSRETTRASVVPTSVVDPVVEEYSLTAPRGARVAPGALKTQRSRVVPGGGQRVLSQPQPVSGYGAVGITWEHGAAVPDDRIRFKVRLRDAGQWSGWTPMVYHDDHGPDPDSEEGRHARPGTDELLVGDVESVQVEVISDDAVPADLKLAVIDPGVPTGTALERPALDTGADSAEPALATPATDTGTGEDGDLALAAAAFTPKPTIYSRKQWGADERMRDPGSLHYYEVHAGFVHHTVNANNYSRADVPAILRGIYAYHTQSRGWSDVGYNFLVDRFGRIWEGRAGGIDRPVVGAHTLGYNDEAFAMSAIGNFDITQPSNAMVQAYGALFAWKLSLHGVDASSRKQFVVSRDFAAINGHRDAASTACPGKYLYARIPDIRRLATQAQVGWQGRELESSVASGPRPDLVVRDKATKRAFIIPINTDKAGNYVVGKRMRTNIDLARADKVMMAGDWDRDGHTDIIQRRASDGTLFLRRGTSTPRFHPGIRLARGFKDVDLLAAVGDMTGDGWPDLMGQPKGGAMRIYPGNGTRGLKPSYVAYSGVSGWRQIPAGRWGQDGAPDVLVRSGPRLQVYPGNGPGGLTGSRMLSQLDVSPYDWVVAVSDVGLKGVQGHSDLVLRRKGSGDLVLVEATARSFKAPVVIGKGFKAYDMVN
jgi:hypothetical protein